MLDALQLQWQIWQAAGRLGSPDDAERARAMQLLTEAGAASLPRLKRLARASDARVQFGAAIVLHRLGDPDGMATLVEALKWRLQTDRELGAELESAFVAIGAPDAVTVLIREWGSLAEWTDHYPAITLICRVWARLRDPRAIDALIPRAQRSPDLFVQTIPAFGEVAIPALERMAYERDVQRRILAIRALGGIPGARSFAALVPLLRDADPEMRSAVPMALLEAGGAVLTRNELLASMGEGYSSRSGVETLLRLGPPPYEMLLALVSRWDPQTLTPKGDTGGAVLAAMAALNHAPWPHARLLPPLRELLQRQPGAELIARIAHVIGMRGQSGSPMDAEARETLWPLLAHTDEAVRKETAFALERMGDRLGQQMLLLLAESRPSGSLLTRLETLLRGGPDASVVAAQTVQQVSQWVSRMSRETVERLAAPSGGRPNVPPGYVHDSRLPDLLRRLLGNTLDSLPRLSAPAEVEEILTLAASALRALARIGPPAALIAREEILRALQFVKRNMVYEGNPTGPFRRSAEREVGAMVRSAATETLFDLYNTESFPLLLETLYSPQWECAETAIFALGRLGDVRALPHLQRFALSPEALAATQNASPLTLAANQAIAAIKKTNPEMMYLLRASSAIDTRPDTLLRPAAGGPPDAAPETLLRPSAQHPVTET